MFNVGTIGLSIRMSSRNDRRGLKAETTPFLKTVYQTLCELTTILAEIQSIKEGKYHALLAFLNPPKVFFPLSESKPILCWSSGRQEWFSPFLWISCIYPRNESNKDDPAFMYDMNNNRRNKAQQVLRTGWGYVWRKLKSHEINSNVKQIESTSYTVFYIQTQSTP